MQKTAELKLRDSRNLFDWYNGSVWPRRPWTMEVLDPRTFARLPSPTKYDLNGDTRTGFVWIVTTRNKCPNVDLVVFRCNNIGCVRLKQLQRIPIPGQMFDTKKETNQVGDVALLRKNNTDLNAISKANGDEE